MRLAIMQPYFFPYLGHFSLIAACDEWIVFDISQYTPRTWINRNRILHPAAGTKWLTVPLANSSIHIPIRDATIQDPAGLHRTVVGQLAHYRRAPHYAAVLSLLDDIFDGCGTSLVALNVKALAAMCRAIGLPFRHRICSDLGLQFPAGLGPGQWAPHICSALGATSYINPAGGRGLFDPADFAERGLDLAFLHSHPFAYRSGQFPFQPSLSILDVLMWNDTSTVLAAIQNYRLEPVPTLIPA